MLKESSRSWEDTKIAIYVSKTQIYSYNKRAPVDWFEVSWKHSNFPFIFLIVIKCCNKMFSYHCVYGNQKTFSSELPSNLVAHCLVLGGILTGSGQLPVFIFLKINFSYTAILVCMQHTQRLDGCADGHHSTGDSFAVLHLNILGWR